MPRGVGFYDTTVQGSTLMQITIVPPRRIVLLHRLGCQQDSFQISHFQISHFPPGTDLGAFYKNVRGVWASQRKGTGVEMSTTELPIGLAGGKLRTKSHSLGLLLLQIGVRTATHQVIRTAGWCTPLLCALQYLRKLVTAGW